MALSIKQIQAVSWPQSKEWANTSSTWSFLSDSTNAPPLSAMGVSSGGSAMEVPALTITLGSPLGSTSGNLTTPVNWSYSSPYQISEPPVLNMKNDPKPLIEYLLGDSKNSIPKSYEEDDDNDDCEHCECYHDGGSCCDCDDTNSDYDED